MVSPPRPSTSGSRPIRKLAREMADNGMLEPATAAAIERVPGVEKRGNRVGNWLMKEQANSLLNAPSSKTLTGVRDRAILALLLGCGAAPGRAASHQVRGSATAGGSLGAARHGRKG